MMLLQTFMQAGSLFGLKTDFDDNILDFLLGALNAHFWVSDIDNIINLIW